MTLTGKWLQDNGYQSGLAMSPALAVQSYINETKSTLSPVNCKDQS